MNDFPHMYRALCQLLLGQEPFHTGRWQSIDTSHEPLRATYELQDAIIRWPIPDTIQELQEEVAANLPWAEEHFSERVGGLPLNPPPSNERWPWARHNKRFQQEGDTQKPFSHSYPERMWPKHATVNGHNDLGGLEVETNQGIRYRLGDLRDVVELLIREPLTRQAYLPIWFPEDTGVVHGERVPCTLGYHFMMRDGRLTCRYYMRSCDIIRHLQDDVYMAARLTQWICEEVNSKGQLEDEPMLPGTLIMYISSLHAFKGDEYKLIKASRGE